MNETPKDRCQGIKDNGNGICISVQPGISRLLSRAILTVLLTFSIVFLLSGYGITQDNPKYVFVFMGDGMGINQVASARYWEALEAEHSASDSIWNASSFDSFPIIGMMSTHSLNHAVTDSAASATALFSGKKTRNGSLNYNPDTKEQYVPFAKILSDNGYAVGVISTTTLDHASPAALYASAKKRSDYLDIAHQGISCGWLDYWAAGGFHTEEEALLDEAEKEGFTVVDSQLELEAADEHSLPILAVIRDYIATPSMAYEIDRARRQQHGTAETSFADLVEHAATCLQRTGNFFLFAEAGKIDVACSNLDVVTSIHEVKGLDDAVARALDFYNDYPDETLIVVLADHETGSLRIGGKIDSNAISEQVASIARFRRIMRDLYKSKADFSEAMEKADHYLGITEENLTPEEQGGLKTAYERTKNGVETDEFTTLLYKIKAAQINMEFVSEDHSGQPVVVYALGCGSERFAGMYDNTDIFKKLCSIMKLH